MPAESVTIVEPISVSPLGLVHFTVYGAIPPEQDTVTESIDPAQIVLDDCPLTDIVSIISNMIRVTMELVIMSLQSILFIFIVFISFSFTNNCPDDCATPFIDLYCCTVDTAYISHFVLYSIDTAAF